MQLTGLIDSLRSSTVYTSLVEQLQQHSLTDGLNVIRAARPFVLGALAHDWHGPIIYITGRVDRAYNVSEQLPVWSPESQVHRFAEPTPLFYDRAPWGENVIRSRISTLGALMPPDDFAETDTHPIIVTSARAIMQRTLPVNTFRKESILLRPGDRYPIDRLLEQCVKLGYSPTSMVIEPGTFSRRGGLVDIFPMTASEPVRIDYFDEEIDQLRIFDPATQRSQTQIPLLMIPPAREVLPSLTPPLAVHLRDWFESLPEDAASPRMDYEPLSNGVVFPHLEHYIPYVYPQVSLLDYAPEHTLIVVEDWTELRDTIAGIEESALKHREEKISARQLAPDHPLPYITWDALVDELEQRRTVHLGPSIYESQSSINLQGVFAPGPRFGGQLRLMLDQLREMRQSGRVVVVTAQAPRLSELWHEQEGFIPTVNDVTEMPQPGSLWFVNGALQEGWRLRTDEGDTHLLTDHEIFGWSRHEPRRRKVEHRAKVPESSYADLQDGDYVVHVDYGVGRFAGMRRRTIEGNEREYLLVEYAGTDMVFVPIHQADRLTKYIGADDRPPALNHLGKPDWIRTRGKAQKAVEEEAKELLELYARRSQVHRDPFGEDSHWQHELEASFPFVETQDQLRAVREVKADMERDFPMDRLICGDVGYGKTEVALRAAFKAVTDGKQVAVLVPTTVLAQQHYENFSLRLTPFPVNVEMLSRFRTKEEQNQLLPKIASGEIDIIIGTHRLLSDDVTFKDLGLVIIDEEQRFGVTHKEHFKRLRTQVDVLTLTATPIPRTLYMSLAGVRDISMIHTPPEERLPVITHVGPYDEQLVRQAVLREIERGGQIFYVHNRVNSIDMARERLESVVPEIRTIVAHGQMHERTLEKVMIAFGQGDYDALVSTSIIESGIDIPNANTLIVDRADWFGMAQLYQLRGRVGRSAQQAYAYFFHPGAGRLTNEARIRLETLAENTELGSGFQIAMRDLELRGAGDILSTRQTGQVAAVGLHLYTQMLTEAVRRLKGEQQPEAIPSASQTTIPIDLPLPAYLPTAWIPEMDLRLQIYRRIAGLTTPEEVDIIRDELSDRFGPLPPAVENLLYQIDIKLLAQAANASAVVSQNGNILIKLPYLATINRESLQRQLGEDIRVTRTAVEVPLQRDRDTWQLQLLSILEKLAQAVEATADATGV